MAEKTYEVEQLGQISVSAFADATGAYDHIKPDEGEGDESEADGAPQYGSDLDSVRNSPEDVGEEEGDEDDGEGDEEEEDDGEEEADGDEGEDDEVDEDEEEEEEEEEESEVDEEAAKLPQKKKLVATTKSGKKIVVPKDALVKHRVDGQEVDLTVQDLLNDYAGRSVINKRINEADVVTKQAEAKLNAAEQITKDYQDTFQKIMACMAQGKPDAAIDILATLTGEDPVPYFEKLIEKSLEYADAWGSMDDSEKRAWKADQRARYLEQKAAAEALKYQRVQTQQQVDSYVNDALNRTGIAPQAFYNKVNELAKDGKLVQPSPQERANVVIGHLLADKHIEQVEAVARSFGKRVTPKMKQLVAQHTTPQDGQDSIREIFRSLLKEQKETVAKTLSGKVRANTSMKTKKKESRAGQNKKEEAGSYSSYLDLMDNSY
jgi:hypothetical protein